MTELITTIDQWQQLRPTLHDHTIGLVPTMGNLHRGHLSLVERSVADNALTVLSCFVNPMQFNNRQDFIHYRRTLQQDILLCKKAGVDYLFAPDDSEMYPDNYCYRISENQLALLMEGVHRPGHFDGMLTIVLKLLLLIKANRAYFGQKDYQQLQLVRGMAQAFFIETQIIDCPTVRDNSGLAMSSRNHDLTNSQMALSRYIYRYLCSDLSCDAVAAALEAKGFVVDYVEEYQGRRFVAAWLGSVRLIDNVEVSSC